MPGRQGVFAAISELLLSAICHWCRRRLTRGAGDVTSVPPRVDVGSGGRATRSAVCTLEQQGDLDEAQGQNPLRRSVVVRAIRRIVGLPSLSGCPRLSVSETKWQSTWHTGSVTDRHQAPARTFRPPPEVYEAAQKVLAERGWTINDFVSASLSLVTQNTDAMLKRLSQFRPPERRGRPKKDQPSTASGRARKAGGR